MMDGWFLYAGKKYVTAVMGFTGAQYARYYINQPWLLDLSGMLTLSCEDTSFGRPERKMSSRASALCMILWG